MLLTQKTGERQLPGYNTITNRAKKGGDYDLAKIHKYTGTAQGVPPGSACKQRAFSQHINPF